MLIGNKSLVYCLCRQKEYIYIGAGGNHSRIFGKVQGLAIKNDHLEIWFFNSATEALLFEANLIEARKPRCNKANPNLLEIIPTDTSPDAVLNYGENFFIELCWPSPVRDKLSQTRNAKFFMGRPEIRRKLSEAGKRNWKNPLFRATMLESLNSPKRKRKQLENRISKLKRKLENMNNANR